MQGSILRKLVEPRVWCFGEPYSAFLEMRLGWGTKAERRDDGVGNFQRQGVLGVDVANQGDGEVAGDNRGENVSGSRMPLAYCIVRGRQRGAASAITTPACRRPTQEGSLMGTAVPFPAPGQT